jgi:hypothetical protein
MVRPFARLWSCEDIVDSGSGFIRKKAPKPLPRVLEVLLRQHAAAGKRKLL